MPLMIKDRSSNSKFIEVGLELDGAEVNITFNGKIALWIRQTEEGKCELYGVGPEDYLVCKSGYLIPWE